MLMYWTHTWVRTWTGTLPGHRAWTLTKVGFRKKLEFSDKFLRIFVTFSNFVISLCIHTVDKTNSPHPDPKHMYATALSVSCLPVPPSAYSHRLFPRSLPLHLSFHRSSAASLSISLLFFSISSIWIIQRESGFRTSPTSPFLIHFDI